MIYKSPKVNDEFNFKEQKFISIEVNNFEKIKFRFGILIYLFIVSFYFFFFSRFERYERALVKGHKQRLDLNESKENIDIDTHVCKSQVMQLMQEGHKLR